jgi:hypothetical protein
MQAVAAEFSGCAEIFCCFGDGVCAAWCWSRAFLTGSSIAEARLNLPGSCRSADGSPSPKSSITIHGVSFQPARDKKQHRDRDIERNGELRADKSEQHCQQMQHRVERALYHCSL